MVHLVHHDVLRLVHLVGVLPVEVVLVELDASIIHVGFLEDDLGSLGFLRPLSDFFGLGLGFGLIDFLSRKLGFL